MNENLARKMASRNEFDKTIAETEAAYMKVAAGQAPGAWLWRGSWGRPPTTSLAAQRAPCAHILSTQSIQTSLCPSQHTHLSPVPVVRCGSWRAASLLAALQGLYKGLVLLREFNWQILNAPWAVFSPRAMSLLRLTQSSLLKYP